MSLFPDELMPRSKKVYNNNFAVTLDALSWHSHSKGDIERGVELYRSGGVEFVQDDPVYFRVMVPIPGEEPKAVAVMFSDDGSDLAEYRCGCSHLNERHGQLCRHVVAAVLTIQGGLADETKAPKHEISFRVATRADVPQIFHFICELAEYEKLLHQVSAHAVETLEEWLFDKKAAEVIFAQVNSMSVGFALYFSNFSTFLGKAWLYLEDLYIQPRYRGHGLGKATLKHLARISVERGYGRMEWSCLDWNKPSIDFYRSLGAEAMSDWTVYRLSDDTLKKLAEG